MACSTYNTSFSGPNVHTSVRTSSDEKGGCGTVSKWCEAEHYHFEDSAHVTAIPGIYYAWQSLDV